MKKILLTLTFCGLTLIMKSQNASVEQSTFGIQTGILGIWGHNELKLSNQIALRSELGFDTGIYGSKANEVDGLILAPTLTIEPRWYYNLNKRERKSKRIDGNSGNFISIKTTYHPDWFIIANEDNINFISDISIIPTWGIRRNIGNHFNYETGIGIGYVHYFKEDNVVLLNESGVAVNLHLRIGYRF
ncbi:hypothetical protein [Winogradskyella sp.]|jgi:hypothetical protein|uniref:hypothetical protein n=1 Tax=Winogradskyella sp. TaxID=1883156 RepID=UPI0025D26877|nr:hypothetical protein [Winogradskyella sp.]MCT4629808.1 hypothetical protein [Winogradskyella sp.]